MYPNFSNRSFKFTFNSDIPPLESTSLLVSLDVLLKNIVPLTMKHFEHIILKLFANKEDEKSLLNPIFIKLLAECTEDEHFNSLANEIKTKIQHSPQLQQLRKAFKKGELKVF